MKNIVCFDLETTGLDRNKDQIIQISMIKFNPKNFFLKFLLSNFLSKIASYTFWSSGNVKYFGSKDSTIVLLIILCLIVC